MPFGSLFKRKNDVSVSIVPRTPSILRRRSTRESSKSQRKAPTAMIPDQNLVAPSFPAPAAPIPPAIAITNTAGDTHFDTPPAYSEVPSSSTSRPPLNPRPSDMSQASKISVTTADDPYAFLSSFDTVFLIDDSGSMAGRSWRETADALSAIAPICAAHDNDGVDVIFMNTVQKAAHRNLKSANDIQRVFASTRPGGATPTGATLDKILRPYLRDCEVRGHERVKPLNIIVITDGVPTDDPESVIVQAAKRLDKIDAPGWQVGIQFFQVGREAGAAEALAELDDGLVELGCPRDIVDTVPWKGQLSAQGMLKVLLGAVNRRIDRRRNSGESTR